MLDKNGNEITFEEEVSKNRSALCEIKEYLLQKSLTSAMKESYMDPFTIQSYYINNVFDYIVNKYSAIDMLKYKMYPDFPECFNDDMAPLILPRFEERNGEKVLLVSGDGGKKFKEYDEINEKYGKLTNLVQNDDLRVYATPNSLTRLALLLHMPDPNCRNFDLFVKPYSIGYDVFKMRDVCKKRYDYYCKFWRIPEKGGTKWYTEFEYPSQRKTELEESTHKKREDIQLDSKYKEQRIDMDEYNLRKDDQNIYYPEKTPYELGISKYEKMHLLKDVEFIGSYSVPKKIVLTDNTERSAINYFTRAASEKNAGEAFHKAMINERQL